MNLISQPSPTKIGNLKANKIIYTIKREEKTFKCLAFVINQHNNFTYIITYQASIKDFDPHLPRANDIINSFGVLP